MKSASDMTMEKVRLLIVDDNQASCVVQTYVIEENFKNVEVTSNIQPPPMEEMLGYDGIILDERLNSDSGIDIAKRIHDENWRIPLMIMTTLRPNNPLFENAYDVVDYVATKGDPAMFVKNMRAFLRQVLRIRAVRLTGTEH
jgi:response regulator RpfG family c-di-GMP phosphodiesterase